MELLAVNIVRYANNKTYAQGQNTKITPRQGFYNEVEPCKSNMKVEHKTKDKNKTPKTWCQ